jgi:hypothetical protein
MLGKRSSQNWKSVSLFAETVIEKSIRTITGGIKMPNKDKEKQLAIQRAWYARHKKNAMQRVATRKTELKRWFMKLKSDKGCSQCGMKNPVCIDFHHIEPRTKKQTPAEMPNQGYSKKTIENELAKCIALCVNCHRTVHEKEKRACPNSNRDCNAPNVE